MYSFTSVQVFGLPDSTGPFQFPSKIVTPVSSIVEQFIFYCFFLCQILFFCKLLFILFLALTVIHFVFNFIFCALKYLVFITANCPDSFHCFSFYLYIYPLDLQKSNKGTIHRTSNYLLLLPEMPRYCCLVEIFYFDFLVLFIEI